jgi:hypothetical protein
MLSPDPMHTLFNGWMTMLDPDEDFVWDDRQNVLGWEEMEDEDIGPYESPTMVPMMSPWPAGWFNTTDGKSAVPYHHEQMAWAAFSLSLKTIAKIIGGKADSYQHNDYEEAGVTPRPSYSFRFTPGESGWQCSEGARL